MEDHLLGEVEDQEEASLEKVGDIMSDDKKDKTLGYEPNLDYEEDYSTEYTHIEYDDEYTGGVQYDDDIMNDIQNNMDNLTILIPGLPLQMQTVVNQVFKPVLLDWRKNFKDKRYPSRIPDSDVPEIIPIDPYPEPDPIPPPNPGPTPPDDPGGKDPDDDEEKDPDPDDDDDGGKDPDDDDDDKKDPNDDEEKDPNDDDDKDPSDDDDDDDDDEDDDGGGGGKDPKDPWIPGYHPPGGIDPYDPYDPNFEFIYDDYEDEWPGIDETDDEDSLFSPGGSKKFNFVEYDDYEIFELEYIKNISDLYNYYTHELNKIIGDYYKIILAMYGQAMQDKDNLDFIGNDIPKESADTVRELRHVMDTALRNEVMGNLKISFSISMFSVESTLYHIKNIKTVQALRLRYAEQKKIGNKELLDSLSNRMLNGIREMYDAKYDNAYINWYKYLISSLEVLADIMNTYLSGLRSKEIIMKKGGTKK
jgi:hypothetical protein